MKNSVIKKISIILFATLIFLAVTAFCDNSFFVLKENNLDDDNSFLVTQDVEHVNYQDCKQCENAFGDFYHHQCLTAICCSGNKTTSCSTLQNGQSEVVTSGENSTKLQKTSSFFTNFASSNESRSHNIALAANNFSWITINKGEVLSFNKLVGARREDRGYKIGKIIMDGEYISGVGGGVCQVSSTLYNAWIRANLGVVSVKAHSLPTSYCELSQDATVSDYIDMVLVNDSDSDIVINGFTFNKNLQFDIYSKPSRYSIKIATKIVELIPSRQTIIEYVPSLDGYDTKTIENNEQIAIVREGKCGYKSYALIQYFLNGKLEHEKVFRRDVYVPVSRKICKVPKAQLF